MIEILNALENNTLGRLNMRCPVCGAKLIGKQLCPYCKVTDKQILNASNKKVKEYRKSGNKDLICNTNVLPGDVSRLKLILYTIFLGWCGVNHFYVLRNIRGTYAVVSTAGSIGIMALGLVIKSLVGAWAVIYDILYSVFFYMMAINVILWVFDIFAVIFRTFKVPVVLAKKGEKND